MTPPRQTCFLCGLVSDDLRIVSLAIVRLDTAKPSCHSYEWQPRCRDRRACDARRLDAKPELQLA